MKQIKYSQRNINLIIFHSRDKMTKIKTDDSRTMEGFRIIEKYYDTPEKLTRAEHKRLKELGIEV
jgi:hypothetical protein